MWFYATCIVRYRFLGGVKKGGGVGGSNPHIVSGFGKSPLAVEGAKWTKKGVKNRYLTIHVA